MQNRICNVLNRPFPLFLSCRKGCIYYIWLIFIMMIIANILQPLELINWHELHKTLIMDFYVILFFGMYVLLYLVLSYVRLYHYHPDRWTIKKELQVLMFYLPATACSTFLYAGFTIRGFKLNLSYFIHLQSYNILLSGLSIPTFGFFVDARLNSNSTALRSWRREYAGKNMNKQQASDTLQKLHNAMETQQLYRSAKCSQQYVSEHTGIPVYRISTAINNFTDDNFTDFVNRYRVEHVCRILREGKNKRLKLEAVGLECGFGSKVNFYAAFRKFTGKTPAEYLAGL